MTEQRHRPQQAAANYPDELRLWECECGEAPEAPDDLRPFERRRWTLDAVQAHAIRESVAPESAVAGRRISDIPELSPATPRHRDTDALSAVTEAAQRLRRSHDALRSSVRDFDDLAAVLDRRLVELARIIGS